MKFIVVTTDKRKCFGQGTITFSDTKLFFDDILGKEVEIPFSKILEIKEDREEFIPFPDEEAVKVFNEFPNVSEFWYTSDKQVFLEVKKAVEHSLTLSNTIVINYSILEDATVQT